MAREPLQSSPRWAPRCLLAATLLWSAGCGVSVAPSYLIDELKVLAVVADPPDIGPGQNSALRAYIAAPQNPNGPISTLWTYCTSHDASGTAQTCDAPQVLSQDSPAQVANGIFTVAAAFNADPALTADVPPQVLDAGFWVQVMVTVNAPGQHAAQAVKRVTISSGAQPRNTNPLLRKVDVWAAGNLTSTPHSVHAKDTLQLVPDYDPTNFQQYQVLNNDGTTTQMVESASFTWSISQGQLNSATSSGDQTVVWGLPSNAANTQQEFVAVLRDGRGGTAVMAADVQVLP